jgi:hypothetical protein
MKPHRLPAILKKDTAMKKSAFAAAFTLAAALMMSGCASRPDVAIGAPMPDDGSILAGRLQGSERIYTTRAGTTAGSYEEAKSYCAALRENGRSDWHLPRRPELTEMFNNRAAVGGFNTADPNGAAWYWKPTPEYFNATAQNISDMNQYYYGQKNLGPQVRCVRNDF